ncbi:MAG: hypothetical protein M3315_11105 [Actinomycetota bacterium]|nr:hypothetical protein [Actinomycetota bacterium]
MPRRVVLRWTTSLLLPATLWQAQGIETRGWRPNGTVRIPHPRQQGAPAERTTLLGPIIGGVLAALLYDRVMAQTEGPA